MVKNKKNRGFLNSVIGGFIEILEDKPTYSSNYHFYAILIGWFFFQMTDYLYSDLDVAITNEYNKVAQLIEYNSTGTFLLFYKDSTELTVFFQIVINSFMLILLLYIAYVGIRVYYDENWLTKRKEQLGFWNQKINIFFLLHQWGLFVPFYEINMGTFMCGPFCFFSDHYLEVPCTIPITQIALSIIGLILNSFICILSTAFYKNNEFCESNQLKKRFSWVQMILLVLYFMIIYITFSATASLLVKFLAFQAVIIILIFDLMWSILLRNNKLIKIYIIWMVFFESTFFVYSYLLLNPKVSDAEMLYQVLIFSSLGSTFLLTFWGFRYDSIMKLNLKEFKKYYKQMDFYLEELFTLSNQAKCDEVSKYKAHELILFHKSKCALVECFCHSISSKENGKSLSSNDFQRLIENLFIWSLEQDVLKKDKIEWENLSLKFLSFSEKYLNNPTLTYYQIKCHIFQQKQKTFYYSVICDVMAHKIKQSIEEKKKRDQQEVIEKKSQVRKLMSHLTEQDRMREKIMPLIQNFLTQKIKLWNIIKNPSLSLNLLSEKSEELSNLFCNLQQNYFRENLNSDSLINQSQAENSNGIILKVKSIFKGIVLNQLLLAKHIEQKMQEVVKKDAFRYQGSLSSLAFLKGNVVSLLVSLIYRKGEIINENKNQILNFFGYNKEDQLERLDQLMPSLFSENHTQMMLNILKKSQSNLFNGDFKTFAITKQGFIIPIIVQIQFMNNFKDDFILNGCILKLETPNLYIIYSENGTIKGISEKLYQILFSNIVFGIHSNSQQHDKEEEKIHKIVDKLNILFIIPDLIRKIQKNQKQNQIDQLNESTKEGSEMSLPEDKSASSAMIVPNSLPNLIQSFEKEKKESGGKKIIECFKLFYQANKMEWDNSDSNMQIINYNIIDRTIQYEDNNHQKKTKNYYILEITNLQTQKVLLENYPVQRSLLKDSQGNCSALQEIKQVKLNLTIQNDQISTDRWMKQNNFLSSEKNLCDLSTHFNKQQLIIEEPQYYNIMSNFSQSKGNQNARLLQSEQGKQIISVQDIQSMISVHQEYQTLLNQTVSHSPDTDRFMAAGTYGLSPSNRNEQTIENQALISYGHDCNMNKKQEKKFNFSKEKTEFDCSTTDKGLSSKLLIDLQKKNETSKYLSKNDNKSTTFLHKTTSLNEVKESEGHTSVTSIIPQNEIILKIKRKESFIKVKPSIYSQLQQSEFHDNQIIQQIVSCRYPRVLNLFNFLINGRLFAISIIVIMISAITLSQISNLDTKLDNFSSIGKLKMLFCEQAMLSFKRYQIEEGVLKLDDFESQKLTDKMQEVSDLYKDQQVDNLLSINEINVNEDNLVITTLFSLNSQFDVNLNPLEFLLKVMNVIIGISTQLSFKNTIDLYFINKNFIPFSDLFLRYGQQMKNNIENMFQQLNLEYSVLEGAILACCTSFLICGIYSLNRIVNYKKNILLLLARISPSDIEKELFVLMNCEQQLKNTKLNMYEFNLTSFISYLTDQYTLNKKKVSTNKKKVSNMVSTNLIGQKLKTFKLFSLVILVIELSGILIVGVLLLAYIQSINIRPSFNHLKSTSDLYSAFNSAIVINEIISSQELIALSDSQYPLQNMTEANDLIEKSILTIDNYLGEFLKLTNNLNDSLASQKILLFSLFSEDICKHFSTETLCDPLQQDQLSESELIIKNIFQSGVSGLLTEYKQLILQFKNTLNQENVLIRQQSLLQLINSQNAYSLALEAYNMPIMALDLLLDTSTDCSCKSAQKLISITHYYCILSGILIVFFQFWIDLWIKSKLLFALRKINVILSFIPLSVASEEATTQILKSILNI